MTRSLLAGAAYFAIVFSTAFALGVLRVTFIAPALGVVGATLWELPLTLAASWLACGWIVRRFGISILNDAIAMALSAFVLLIGAELAGSHLLFGRTLRVQLDLFGTPAGALGLAGQIAFGVFPLIQYAIKAKAARAQTR